MSSLACTAVVAPASANRFQLRITLGAMSSSRLSSATVFSPVTIRWTVVRLNSVVNTRRPSAFRRCSPMGPPAASYVPAVSSRNGEHSTCRSHSDKCHESGLCLKVWSRSRSRSLLTAGDRSHDINDGPASVHHHHGWEHAGRAARRQRADDGAAPHPCGGLDHAKLRSYRRRTGPLVDLACWRPDMKIGPSRWHRRSSVYLSRSRCCSEVSPRLPANRHLRERR